LDGEEVGDNDGEKDDGAIDGEEVFAVHDEKID
jgi:hypothetical protein